MEAAEAELTNQLSMSSEATTTTSLEEAGNEGVDIEQVQLPPLKHFCYLSGIVSDKCQEWTSTSHAGSTTSYQLSEPLFSKFASRR